MKTEPPIESTADRPALIRETSALGRFHYPASADRTAPGSFPGLVLVHDVWGLSEHSLDLATDLAAEGFGVLEIDLYRGLGDFVGDYVIEDPGAHIRSLSDPAVLADLEAGADWLATTPICRGRKIGVFGVCMGGTFTALAACLSDRFSAAAPFYGILSYEHGMLADPVARDRARKPSSPLEAAGMLCTPMLASFGRDDQLVPLSDVEAFEQVLASAGTRFEIDCYSEAGHAFLNRTRSEAYRPEAAAAAWARVVPFLHAQLD